MRKRGESLKRHLREKTKSDLQPYILHNLLAIINDIYYIYYSYKKYLKE